MFACCIVTAVLLNVAFPNSHSEPYWSTTFLFVCTETTQLHKERCFLGWALKNVLMPLKTIYGVRAVGIRPALLTTTCCLWIEDLFHNHLSTICPACVTHVFLWALIRLLTVAWRMLVYSTSTVVPSYRILAGKLIPSIIEKKKKK